MQLQAFDVNDYIEKQKKQKKERTVIVMYSVFGDESADEKTQRVYAVSGVGCSEAQWDDFEQVWIERTSGVPFRPADCEADRGYYKQFPHEENLRLYKDLVILLANSNIMGCATIVDLKCTSQEKCLQL